jgi:hypothetical protein
MQYDLIMWFIMFTIYWFNKDKVTTKLPLLIISSNFICMLLFNLPDGVLYYCLEGIRHTITLTLVYYLYVREGYINYYLFYFLVYIGIITLFLLSLFVVVSNIDIDIFGAVLNTLEFMVFIYGIFFIKSRHSCLGSR